MAELRVVRKVQCGGCKKYFTGNSAFYAHRTGGYGEAAYDERGKVAGYTHSRRCLTDDEMKAAGFASEQLLVKMYLDGKPIREEHDAWYIVADREAMRKAFGRGSTEDEEDEDEDEEDDE